LAHGLPIVATRVGGLPEAVEHGVTGYLVNPSDSTALAEAIKDLLLDHPKRRRMGQASRDRMREVFSVDRLISDHEEMFRGCLRH
jgi:glycosyltransferase involved in cell wall biosynthesis